MLFSFVMFLVSERAVTDKYLCKNIYMKQNIKMKEPKNQKRPWDNFQTIRYFFCWQTFLKICHPLSKQYLELVRPTLAASNWKTCHKV